MDTMVDPKDEQGMHKVQYVNDHMVKVEEVIKEIRRLSKPCS
jgi:hypothetical protein